VTVQSNVSDCKCSSSVVMQDSKLVTVTQPSQPSPQQPQNYMLTIIVKPNSTVGSISKNPDLSSYASGSQVTLTATPSTGFNFSNWQIDGVNSSDNPIVITMSSNKTVYAWFVVAGARLVEEVRLAGKVEQAMKRVGPATIVAIGQHAYGALNFKSLSE